MRVHESPLPGVMIVELNHFSDERGYFSERFHLGRFEEIGLPFKFVQDNHSRSYPGVLRGLHYQYAPAQGKLVGVIRGRIWDVAVDLRPESPHYGKHFGLELSDKNHQMLWIPPDFAHGFCVLGDEPADVLYKVTNFYNGKCEGCIRWNDPELNIPWPLTKPIVSARDEQGQDFASFKKAPPVWKY